MTGVFTSIYVLTIACYGVLCGPNDGREFRVEMPDSQLCEMLRASVHSGTAHRMITGSCHGELREMRADQLNGAPLSRAR